MNPARTTNDSLRNFECALAQIDTADISQMREVLKLLLEDKVAELRLALSEF